VWPRRHRTNDLNPNGITHAGGQRRGPVFSDLRRACLTVLSCVGCRMAIAQRHMDCNLADDNTESDRLILQEEVIDGRTGSTRRAY
jgi:hypothetical protein